MARQIPPNKLVVATVYDTKAETYFQPFFARTRAEALRSFKQAANQEGHTFNNFPGDFHLFIVAEWDEDTGGFTNLDAPASLGSALEHIEQDLPDDQMSLVQ